MNLRYLTVINGLNFIFKGSGFESRWQFKRRHGKTVLLFFKRAIPGLFFFIFAFLIQLTVNNVQYNCCRRQDLNRGSLVSEATAQPTEPQPLPCCTVVTIDRKIQWKRDQLFKNMCFLCTILSYLLEPQRAQSHPPIISSEHFYQLYLLKLSEKETKMTVHLLYNKVNLKIVETEKQSFAIIVTLYFCTWKRTWVLLVLFAYFCSPEWSRKASSRRCQCECKKMLGANVKRILG